MSIPFFVYSQNLDSMYKTNFNVVENAVWICDTFLESVISNNGQIITNTGTQQSSGAYISLSSRTAWTTSSEDYYTLMFNFPLRRNG